MHRPAKTLFLPAAAALLLFTACKKSAQKPTGTALNTWTFAERYAAPESVFTAASVSRGSDGKLRAVGQNPADSIVFSFYQGQLPVADQDFMATAKADSSFTVSFEAWMGGRHYYSTGPSTIILLSASRITVTNGKLRLDMASSDVQDADWNNPKRYSISANLQEP